MGLPELWFIIVAVLWTGFFFLEGFDFGVGMLSRFLGADEAERGQMLTAIGPVWDADEVWLITGGIAIFAAFPAWYAALFPAAYLPLLIVIVAISTLLLLFIVVFVILLFSRLPCRLTLM